MAELFGRGVAGLLEDMGYSLLEVGFEDQVLVLTPEGEQATVDLWDLADKLCAAFA